MPTCFNCPNKSNLFWTGHGDICDDCFGKLYRKPLLESFTEEERKRAEKIRLNFEGKTHFFGDDCEAEHGKQYNK